MTGELHFIHRIQRRLGTSPPGETWSGDDAAVVCPPDGPLLLTVDPMVEDVHFARHRGDVEADIGWRALARNLSDIAAMGGRPLHCVASLVGGRGWDLDALVDGLVECSDRYACPVVGGDVAAGALLTLTVTVTGTVDGEAVLRSGASPGDVLFVTGPLGAAPTRPEPRLEAGDAARRSGATAMLDLSDGLGLDLDRLAGASGVGVALDALPVAEGASWDDAVSAGESYELVFAARDEDAVMATFEADGLPLPIAIGVCTAEPAERRLGDGDLPVSGWEHEL